MEEILHHLKIARCSDTCHYEPAHLTQAPTPPPELNVATRFGELQLVQDFFHSPGGSMSTRDLNIKAGGRRGCEAKRMMVIRCPVAKWCKISSINCTAGSRRCPPSCDGCRSAGYRRAGSCPSNHTRRPKMMQVYGWREGRVCEANMTITLCLVVHRRKGAAPL